MDDAADLLCTYFSDFLLHMEKVIQLVSLNALGLSFHMVMCSQDSKTNRLSFGRLILILVVLKILCYLCVPS